jgi:hypothetical protein
LLSLGGDGDSAKISIFFFSTRISNSKLSTAETYYTEWKHAA